MRKWVVIGLALVLGVCAVQWVRPKRKRRLSVTRVLGFLALTRLSSWWNPASWLSGVGDIAGSAIADVESWAKKAINTAIGLYDDTISVVIDGINTAITDTEAALGRAYAWALDAYNWVAGAETWLVTRFDSFFNWAWANIIGPAINAVKDAGEDLYNASISFANGILSSLQWWINNVIEPVYNWVQNAESWLQNRVSGLLSSFYATYIQPIVTDVKDAVDKVTQLWDWFTKTAGDAVDLVLKASDWLIWFGEHPFALFGDFEAWITGAITPGWIRSIADQSSTDFEHIEDTFTKAMGL